MSDLFGNHIVGFPTRRLIYVISIDLPYDIFRMHLLNHQIPRNPVLKQWSGLNKISVMSE